MGVSHQPDSHGDVWARISNNSPPRGFGEHGGKAPISHPKCPSGVDLAVVRTVFMHQFDLRATCCDSVNGVQGKRGKVRGAAPTCHGRSWVQ